MKTAIVVLADNESHEGLGRVVNAMVTVREMKEAGDDLKLIFDGGGTVWPGELADPDHKSHRLWESIHDAVHGACSYCAEAFDATQGVDDAGVKLLDEYKRHPSFRSLIADGYRRDAAAVSPTIGDGSRTRLRYRSCPATRRVAAAA